MFKPGVIKSRWRILAFNSETHIFFYLHFNTHGSAVKMFKSYQPPKNVSFVRIVSGFDSVDMSSSLHFSANDFRVSEALNEE